MKKVIVISLRQRETERDIPKLTTFDEKLLLLNN